ncbi:ATP-binding cassette domain-containing protein, partial [Rhizobium ruizarguesonis]
MQAPSVVSAKYLCLTYQANDVPVIALSNVNLDVRKGDFVSFIGPSGCCKTTFLRVIAYLEKSTSGEISINGMTPESCQGNFFSKPERLT